MADQFEKFNQLNLLVSVEDVFDYIGAKMHKEDGFRITYSCPYHADDLPSLLVDNQTNKYNCFACDCGGVGAYSCAKYYLNHQNGVKPTVISVVDFLAEINPKVEQFKYLFTVKAVREYDYDQNKRRDFRNRMKVTTPEIAIAVEKKSFNAKQMAIYIDGIMTGMPEEFIMQALGVQQKNNSPKGSEEFLSLLGD